MYSKCGALTDSICINQECYFKYEFTSSRVKLQQIVLEQFIKTLFM